MNADDVEPIVVSFDEIVGRVRRDIDVRILTRREALMGEAIATTDYDRLDSLAWVLDLRLDDPVGAVACLLGDEVDGTGNPVLRTLVEAR